MTAQNSSANLPSDSRRCSDAQTVCVGRERFSTSFISGRHETKSRTNCKWTSV